MGLASVFREVKYSTAAALQAAQACVKSQLLPALAAALTNTTSDLDAASAEQLAAAVAVYNTVTDLGLPALQAGLPEKDGAVSVAVQAALARLIHAHALLGLFAALLLMWPGGVLKSKDAHCLAAPAAQLALALLKKCGACYNQLQQQQQQQQQQQLQQQPQAVMPDCLSRFAHEALLCLILLIQELSSIIAQSKRTRSVSAGVVDRAGHGAGPYSEALFRSPAALHLLLLVLDVYTQLTGVVSPPPSPAAATAEGAAGGGSNSSTQGSHGKSSRTRGVEQQLLQAYSHQVWQSVGIPQQLREELCIRLSREWGGGVQQKRDSRLLFLCLVLLHGMLSWLNTQLSEEEGPSEVGTAAHAAGAALDAHIAVLRECRALPVALLAIISGDSSDDSSNSPGSWSCRSGSDSNTTGGSAVQLAAGAAGAEYAELCSRLGPGSCGFSIDQALLLVAQNMRDSVAALEGPDPAEAGSSSSSSSSASQANTFCSLAQRQMLCCHSVLGPLGLQWQHDGAGSMGAGQYQPDRWAALQQVAAALEHWARKQVAAEAACAGNGSSRTSASLESLTAFVGCMSALCWLQASYKPGLLLCAACNSLSRLLRETANSSSSSSSSSAGLHLQSFSLLLSSLKVMQGVSLLPKVGSVYKPYLLLWEAVENSAEFAADAVFIKVGAIVSRGSREQALAAGAPWLVLLVHCLLLRVRWMTALLQAEPHGAGALQAAAAAWLLVHLVNSVEELLLCMSRCVSNSYGMPVQRGTAEQKAADSLHSWQVQHAAQQYKPETVASAAYNTTDAGDACWFDIQRLVQLQQQLEAELLPAVVTAQGLAAIVHEHSGAAMQECSSEGRPPRTVSQVIDYTISTASRADAAQRAQLAAAEVQLRQLPGQVQAFAAELLQQLPVPHCCNNPGCTNLAKASELSLVGGKACICSSCQVARYCSRSCQEIHWKQHRRACRRIRAQREAAAAAAQAAAEAAGAAGSSQ